MISDPIGDMLTRIRNGYLASFREVEMPYSKIKGALAEILVKRGYLKKVEIKDEGQKVLSLALKYKNKKPAIEQIEKISNSGKRIYTGFKKIRSVLSGMGIVIVSTSAGLMTGKEARKRKLGGEVICQVW